MSDSAHIIYWKNHLKLVSGYSIRGYSRCREATGFYCPELDMAFDAGVPTNDLPQYICLTHLHADHTAALYRLICNNNKNPIIFIPDNEKFHSLLEQMLRSIFNATKFYHPKSKRAIKPEKYPYEIIKLTNEKPFLFKTTNNCEYYIEVLPAYHGVTAISFGIFEKRRRCRPEYNGLSAEEYVNLKKNNVDIYEYYEKLMMCYLSDTSKRILSDSKFNRILQYPTIIIECTFLADEDLSQAKKKNHLHWKHLWPIISQHNNQFILIHFSQRYTWSYVKKFFDNFMNRQKIEDLNIVLWLHTGIINYKNVIKI